MGTYRKEWDCCGSVTETQSWEPEDCPFCTPAQAAHAGAVDLTLIDTAFENEIKRVSTLAYNSNEICREFYKHLRAAIAASQPQKGSQL